MGNVRKPFSNADCHDTDLGIAHYHHGCVDVRVYNTKNVLVSSGYILDSDSNETMIAKLSALGPNVNSGHKVAIYLDYLNDPAGFKVKSEARSTANVHPGYVFSEISYLVSNLTLEWKGNK